MNRFLYNSGTGAVSDRPKALPVGPLAKFINYCGIRDASDGIEHSVRRNDLNTLGGDVALAKDQSKAGQKI